MFIRPCLPTLRKDPPAGDGWLHEVKFDGWRLQLHKIGKDVVVYSKQGHDFTHRFPEITRAFLRFPARTAIVDAELTACDGQGMPDFSALLSGQHNFLCVWAFDLLMINDKDLRQLPYVERKSRLEPLVKRGRNAHIRYSDHFDDAETLLQACTRMKLEGIVSKRRNAAYRSGASKDWIKVKCTHWREANQWRAQFFEKRKRQ